MKLSVAVTLSFLLTFSICGLALAGSGGGDDIISVEFVEYPETVVGGELAHAVVEIENFTNLVRTFDLWIEVTTPWGTTTMYTLHPELIDPYDNKQLEINVITPFYADLGIYSVTVSAGQYWQDGFAFYGEDVIDVEMSSRSNRFIKNPELSRVFDSWKFYFEN